MYHWILAGWLLRKLAFLGLIGFLGVMLIGPLLGLLGVLLAFSCIGLVFWLPYRLLFCRRPIDWVQLRETGRKWGGRCRGPWQRDAGRVFAPPPEFLYRIWETGRFLRTLVREMTCGALLGVMFGLLIASGSPSSEPIFAGFGIGLATGFVVALLNRRPRLDYTESCRTES